jgi:hypothetical protein
MYQYRYQGCIRFDTKRRAVPLGHWQCVYCKCLRIRRSIQFPHHGIKNSYHQRIAHEQGLVARHGKPQLAGGSKEPHPSGRGIQMQLFVKEEHVMKPLVETTARVNTRLACFMSRASQYMMVLGLWALGMLAPAGPIVLTQVALARTLRLTGWDGPRSR